MLVVMINVSYSVNRLSDLCLHFAGEGCQSLWSFYIVHQFMKLIRRLQLDTTEKIEPLTVGTSMDRHLSLIQLWGLIAVKYLAQKNNLTRIEVATFPLYSSIQSLGIQFQRDQFSFTQVITCIYTSGKCLFLAHSPSPYSYQFKSRSPIINPSDPLWTS